MGAENLTAHHRRQRQRHQRGKRHGSAKRHRELLEEAADRVLEQHQRKDHRDQNSRRRDHREANLPGAPVGGQQRRFPQFDPAADVLDDDDRIVDHQPDRQDQRQQRQHVDRVTQGREYAERRDDGYGDRDGRDQSRPQVAQEDPGDQHHEAERYRQRVEHLIDRLADEDALVIGDTDRGVARQAVAEPVKQPLDAFRHLRRVGGRLLGDAQANGAPAVDRVVAPIFPRAQLDLRHVAQADEVGAALGDHDPGELLRPRQAGVGADGELALVGLDPARRQFRILPPKRCFDVLNSQVAGRQRVAVQPDPHGVDALPADPDVGDTGDGGDLIDQHAPDIVGQFKPAELLAGHSRPQDRRAVAVHLGDHGSIRLVRQAARRP